MSSFVRKLSHLHSSNLCFPEELLGKVKEARWFGLADHRRSAGDEKWLIRSFFQQPPVQRNHGGWEIPHHWDHRNGEVVMGDGIRKNTPIATG